MTARAGASSRTSRTAGTSRRETNLIGGLPRVAGISLRSAGLKVPPGGVTSEVMRRLKMSRLHEAVQKDSARREILTPPSTGTDVVDIRRPGRKGHPDVFFDAIWAKRYVEMCKTTKHPYKPLAEKYPGQAAAPSTNSSLWCVTAN